MKTKLKIIIIAFAFLAVMILFHNTANASELSLNDLKFEAQINKDASITITEYWDIYISETNTIYKTFELDNAKFSNITNVSVSEITTGVEKQFTNVNKEMYHVTKDGYYGLVNSKGDFEIAWGVGLDDETDERIYKISYTVTDAIAKYQDSAELYWKFVGEQFEIPCKNVTGTILLPEYAENKEDIRVWGHTANLNGTIYATASNKVEFELDGLNPGRYLEVRILFPTEMITSATRGENKPIIQEVINEETEWVNEANRIRKREKFIALTIILSTCLVIDIILCIKAKKYKKQYEQMEEKLKPQLELEYFRELPRKNATPAEALMLVSKKIRDLTGEEFGRVFSSTLLNLTLKDYISLEMGSEKEEIIIAKGNKLDEEELLKDEKVIYDFIINDVLNSKEKVTVSELDLYISLHFKKVEKLKENFDSQLQSQLEENELYNKEALKESENIFVGVFLCMLLIISALICLLAVTIFWNEIILLSIMSVLILSIYVTILLGKKFKKLNIFTQNGENEIVKWKALKKYMEDFSLLKEKEVPDLVLWEHFLVFATAFGISKKVIKQLKMVYPNFDESINMSNYTYIYLLSNTNFEKNFSNTISRSITSTYSSATGGGGGFSGGGGGGRWTVAAVADAKIMKMKYKIRQGHIPVFICIKTKTYPHL